MCFKRCLCVNMVDNHYLINYQMIYSAYQITPSMVTPSFIPLPIPLPAPYTILYTELFVCYIWLADYQHNAQPFDCILYVAIQLHLSYSYYILSCYCY